MKGRVLTIEPYDPIRELLVATLHRTSHEVVSVGSGNDALAAMEREHFPCVVVGSPVVVESGGTKVLFLDYLERHCPQWRPCLIVVTTHVEAGEVLAISKRLRVCAVLAKPFSSEDLLDVVDACLAGRHMPTRWIGVREPRAAAGGDITSSAASR